MNDFLSNNWIVFAVATVILLLLRKAVLIYRAKKTINILFKNTLEYIGFDRVDEILQRNEVENIHRQMTTSLYIGLIFTFSLYITIPLTVVGIAFSIVKQIYA